MNSCRLCFPVHGPSVSATEPDETWPAILVWRWRDCQIQGSGQGFPVVAFKLIDAVEKSCIGVWVHAPDKAASWGLDAGVCRAGSAGPGATCRTGASLGRGPQPTAIGDHLPNVRALGEHAAQQGIQVCPARLPPPMVIDQRAQRIEVDAEAGQ